MRTSLWPEGKPSRLDFRPFVRPPLDPAFHQAANEAAYGRPTSGSPAIHARAIQF